MTMTTRSRSPYSDAPPPYEEILELGHDGPSSRLPPASLVALVLAVALVMAGVLGERRLDESEAALQGVQADVGGMTARSNQLAEELELLEEDLQQLRDARDGFLDAWRADEARDEMLLMNPDVTTKVGVLEVRGGVRRTGLGDPEWILPTHSPGARFLGVFWVHNPGRYPVRVNLEVRVVAGRRTWAILSCDSTLLAGRQGPKGLDSAAKMHCTSTQTFRWGWTRIVVTERERSDRGTFEVSR